jgi:GGDEF domain-containing protein
LAYYDELTGLANRNIYDRLQHVHSQARWLNGGAVSGFDRPRYQRQAWPWRDHVLKEAAERLSYCVREGDTLSRLGGDEFVAILRNLTDVEVPAKIAARMVKVLEKPFLFDNDELHITTSVGISVSPNDGDEVTVLLKNADTAMYCAKGLGRSNYQYYEATMNKH